MPHAFDCMTIAICNLTICNLKLFPLRDQRAPVSDLPKLVASLFSMFFLLFSEFRSKIVSQVSPKPPKKRPKSDPNLLQIDVLCENRTGIYKSRNFYKIQRLSRKPQHAIRPRQCSPNTHFRIVLSCENRLRNLRAVS